MKVREVLLERRIQKTSIMYHGTSSTFLSNIMKHGLQPYVGHKSSEAQNPALHSFGGVYLTGDRMFAYTIARTSTQHHKGDPIIITVQYVIRSGGIDEDEFISKFIKEIFYLLGKDKSYDEILQKLITTFTYTSEATVTQKTKKIFIDIIFEIEKLLFYQVLNVLNRQKEELPMPDYLISTINDIIELSKNNYHAALNMLKENKILRQIAIIHNQQRKIFFDNNWYNELDVRQYPTIRKLTLAIINSSTDKKFSKSIRIDRPITFKGKTRIIKIENMKTHETYYENK